MHLVWGWHLTADYPHGFNSIRIGNAGNGNQPAISEQRPTA